MTPFDPQVDNHSLEVSQLFFFFCEYHTSELIVATSRTLTPNLSMKSAIKNSSMESRTVLKSESISNFQNI